MSKNFMCYYHCHRNYEDTTAALFPGRITFLTPGFSCKSNIFPCMYAVITILRLFFMLTYLYFHVLFILIFYIYLYNTTIQYSRYTVNDYAYILIIQIQNVGKTEHYNESLVIWPLVLCLPATYFVRESYLGLRLFIYKLCGFELEPDALWQSPNSLSPELCWLEDGQQQKHISG